MASKIQRAWRRHAAAKKWKLQLQNSILLQRYLKSYLARRRLLYNFVDRKVIEMQKELRPFRIRMMEDAIILIVYHWRKYMKRLKKKTTLKKERPTKNFVQLNA